MPTLRPRKRHPEAPAVSAPISTTPDLKKKVTSTTKAKNEKRLVDDMNSSATDEGRPFLDGDNDGAAAGHSTGVEAPLPESRSWAQRNQWIVYALASGACAAFNGVFAKL